MTTTRADAARSRERILNAARAHRGEEVRMNELAREAGVGVGTVYRHFPTQRALTEALSAGTLERMLDVARAALDEPDTSRALPRFVRQALDLQLDDGGLQAVLTSPDDESASVTATKREIYAAFTTVLDRARADGVVRADLTVLDLQHLICGVEYAVRLTGPARRELYITVLLAGIQQDA